MTRTLGSKNKSTAPETIKDARKRAILKANEVALFWSQTPDSVSRECCRGRIPGAFKRGRYWYVTASSMDRVYGVKGR